MAPKRKAVKESEPEPKKAKIAEGKAKKMTGYSDKWKEIDSSLWYIDYGTKGCDKIAGFDMDQTLINVKGTSKFPKDRNDWVLWDEKIPQVMKKFQKDGFKIVIFTNQKGVTVGKTTLEAILGKIDDLQEALDVPLAAFVLTDDNKYRKPCTAAWDLLEDEYNDNVKVDRTASFYCGDAAGRAKGGEGPSGVLRKKKDHSQGDLLFALNVGAPFKTPERVFRNIDDTDQIPMEFDFDPRKLGEDTTEKEITPSEKPEMIIMVGPPGAGKSSIARKYFGDYEIINQDTLKTKDKVLKAAKAACAAKKSCVIDNQNKETTTRKPFLDIAKEAKMPVRVIYLNFPKDLAFHNNAYRMLNPRVPEHRKHKKSEGFSEIIELSIDNLILGPWDDPLDEKLYRSFCTA
eukprot:Platyproteum_vivax@DN5914_c0_g1_i7.p1